MTIPRQLALGEGTPKLILITLVAVVVGLMVGCGGGSDEYEYPNGMLFRGRL